jgi:hypothetical protein
MVPTLFFYELVGLDHRVGHPIPFGPSPLPVAAD